MRAASIALICAALACVPSPAFAKNVHPGPCRQGQVVSLVNRPGVGPQATTAGSPCTVPRGHVVVEFGYRNEVDAGKGGTSALSSYLMTVLRAGLSKRDEIVLLPASTVIRGGAGVPGLFMPSVGSLDGGIGFKHNIQSHYWYQDAVEVLVTLPTGTNGYSAGAPTYSFTYIGAFSPPGKLGISTTFTLQNAPGTPPTGPPRRFASYGPSLTLSYALDANTSAIVNDNETIPANPAGGSSNVLLVALQRTLSPGVVVNLESETNLTPTGGYREHAVGFGGAFSL